MSNFISDKYYILIFENAFEYSPFFYDNSPIIQKLELVIWLYFESGMYCNVLCISTRLDQVFFKTYY